MTAINFDATIHEGKIVIPPDYREEIPAAVTVSVIPKPPASGAVTDIKSFFGAWKKWANPSLRKLEKSAWEQAAVEKDASR